MKLSAEAIKQPGGLLLKAVASVPGRQSHGCETNSEFLLRAAAVRVCAAYERGGDRR